MPPLPLGGQDHGACGSLGQTPREPEFPGAGSQRAALSLWTLVGSQATPYPHP